MSEIKENVIIGVANEGELIFPLEVVKGWDPKKISYVSSSVFFEQDGTFFSMDRLKFKEIFGSKYLK